MLKNKNNTKIILIVVASLLVVMGVSFAYRTYDMSRNDNWIDGVNYDPPTEEERAAGDKQKEKVDKEEQRQNSQNGDSTEKKTTNVIITDAGQYDDIIEVRSFIPDHYQDGTCTIAFRKGGQTITKGTPAYRDASTTICTNPLIKRSEFPSAGDWQVSVSYDSKDAKGTSETQTITIE